MTANCCDFHGKKLPVMPIVPQDYDKRAAIFPPEKDSPSRIKMIRIVNKFLNAISYTISRHIVTGYYGVQPGLFRGKQDNGITMGI